MELAEQAFATELQRLTAHLAERLTGLHDGQPKVFRDSAVENLREFLERLGRLNIRSSPELDAHVEQAELTINGIEAWRGGRCRMTSEMELVVAADGVARCIYGEELDLREIGRLSITRASHVEPDAEGYWWARHGALWQPVGGVGGGEGVAGSTTHRHRDHQHSQPSQHHTGRLRHGRDFKPERVPAL